MAVNWPTVVDDASSIVWTSFRSVWSAVVRAVLEVDVLVPWEQLVVPVVLELPVDAAAVTALVLVVDVELVVLGVESWLTVVPVE